MNIFASYYMHTFAKYLHSMCLHMHKYANVCNQNDTNMYLYASSMLQDSRYIICR